MNNFFQFNNLSKEPNLFQAVSQRTITSLPELIAALALTNYVISEQVHGDKIFIAENIAQPLQLSGYDSFITKQKNLALIVKTADCLPVLLFDRKQKVIAAVHAGRKSTLLNLAQLTVEKMKESFHSYPQDILAGFGPAICKSCYQIDQLQDIHFDLYQENRNQLLAAGLPAGNIELSGLCTACNAKDKFYSYRQEQAKKRTYNVIMLL